MSSSKSESLHPKDNSSSSSSYIDEYGRRIDSLRISLTQRCGLSCFFCHHEGENRAKKEISLAEIEQIVKHASTHGIRYVKLTGGEPLLREDILDIIRIISPLVPDLSITTNGLFLEDMAYNLKKAGLTRVNVSIHSLDLDVYFKITGSRDLEKVKRGVKKAVEVGLTPVKVNMTILRGFNENSIGEMMEFTSDVGAILQIIEVQQIPVSGHQRNEKLWVDLGPLEENLKERAIKTEKRSLHGRFQYTVPLDRQRTVVVEIVKPMHNTSFCRECTRMRVTSDGKFKPCFYRLDNLVEIFPRDEQIGQDAAIQQAFKLAVSKREPYWRDEH